MFSDPAVNIAKLGVADGMKVVDLGAGSGFYSIEAAKKVGNNGRVYSVDVQKDLLERIRSNGITIGLRNIEVIWGNAEKVGGTKLHDGVADRAISSNILFQLDRPDDYVLEVKRILKVGGKVLVVDWSELSPIGPKNFFSKEKARTLFEKNGFKLEQSFDAGDHHYGMVFIR